MGNKQEVQRARSELRETIQHLKDANHELTLEEVSRTAVELLRHPDGLRRLPEQDRAEGYDILRRSLLDIERRALATLRQDYSRPTIDREFAASPSMSLGQLVELYRTQRETLGVKLIR